MRKQPGLLTSLVFLLATAALWMGCSHNCNDQACCQQPVCCEQSAPAFNADQSAPEFMSMPSQPECCPTPCQPECCDMPQCCPAPQQQCCPAPQQQCCPAPQPKCCPAPQQQCCPAPQGNCCPSPSCCPAPQANCCPPACPPACDEPCKKPVRCHYPPQNELCCRDGIIVTAQNPRLCMLGDQYPLDFDVRACIDVCDVVVVTHLPEGVSFVRAQPEAKVEGRRVVWNFGPMRQGECRPAKLWVKCECEGEQCACFCATAIPVRFCSLLCAKPVLTCHKCGPEEVCPGDAVHYTITVSNKGSCAAEDVVVTDQVPDGLEHSSCQRTLTYKLGTLEPCQSKRINLCFTACKRGKICNTAVVTACNADSTSCQWCTNVCKECVEIYKQGPKEQQIGKNADYQITVVNPGDKPLTEVVVTDQAPNATSIVAANGAAITGNQAVWRMRELKPGEKASFTITLTTCTPGCFTNRVHVTNCQGCTACADFTTRWKGRPALNIQITDTEDPICIGETTSYCITVVNQGSEADSNVAVTVNFPKEIVPLSATGDTQGTVSGQTVTFAPAQNMGPRTTLKYRVDARAAASGDARVNVSVISDSIKTPITQQESTIVN